MSEGSEGFTYKGRAVRVDGSTLTGEWQAWAWPMLEEGPITAASDSALGISRESVTRSIKFIIDVGASKNMTKPKKTEWNIGGIKVTMEKESNALGSEELRTDLYVFHMDGARANVLVGLEALEKIVWLNKLEREQ
jgi:hypothetical protein